MKLRVGYRNYVVRPMTVSEVILESRVGECNPGTGVLRVATAGKYGEFGPEEVADTLLHEVLHAVWRERGLAEEDEESTVTNLAHGLISLMRDNPAFFPLLERMAGGEIPPFLRKRA